MEVTNNLALTISTGWLNSGFKYVDPADWTQKYFYLSTTNTMVFESPWNGARSSTNGGTRSELRETQADGSEYNWQPLGTNTLEATCAVHSAGVSNDQKVIIGQIHSKTVGNPPVVISYNFPDPNRVGKVTLTVRNSPSGSTDQNFTLATGVNLGDLINYKLKLERIGGSITVSATVNGASTNVNMTANDPNWTNQTFYFKAGCYYPDFRNGTAKATFSSLSATHQ